jgi:curved DNA-binding protein
MKDLYHILNLNKSATDTEIKKSYRKLAFQCHPDKNKSEEAKFQFENISEAYDVLSKPDKRRIYDQFGYEAVSESGPQINPLDLFQSLFNVDFMNMTEQMDSNIFIFSDLSSNPFTQLKHKMTYNLEATLEELYHGTKKEFEIHHRIQNNSMKSTKYIINIKRGSKHGDNIVVKEGGNYIPELKSSEDLVIQIIETKHSFYQRKKNDLYIEHKISLIDSLCGCQFTIDHFDEPLTIEIKDIIKPNSMFQVFQKGMPIKKDDIKSLTDSNDSNEKEYGTLIIDLQIIYPDEISEKQIHYLNKIFNVKQENKSNDNAVIAYYYKDIEDVVKELMNEEEEEGMGCIQQ